MPGDTREMDKMHDSTASKKTEKRGVDDGECDGLVQPDRRSSILQINAAFVRLPRRTMLFRGSTEKRRNGDMRTSPIARWSERGDDVERLAHYQEKLHSLCKRQSEEKQKCRIISGCDCATIMHHAPSTAAITFVSSFVSVAVVKLFAY